MTQPTWLADTFAVVMIVMSLYCVGWLVAARVASFRYKGWALLGLTARPSWVNPIGMGSPL